MFDEIIRMLSPKRFFESLRTSWAFAKFGWNDADWDSMYLIKLIQWKLQRMEKFFLSDETYIEDALKVAGEVRHVIDQLEIYLCEKAPHFEKERVKLEEKTGEIYGTLDPTEESIPDWILEKQKLHANDKSRPVFLWFGNAKTEKQNQLWKDERMELYKKEILTRETVLQNALIYTAEKHNQWWD